MSGDSYNLQRFVDAQADTYATALAELRAGRKQSHWMWFIFPQMRGLGSSATAERYGITSRDEAAAYLAHPVLGARLRECVAAVNKIQHKTAADIFGYPDDVKFRSCLTLFAEASGEPAFQQALAKYFDGRNDSSDASLARKRKFVILRPPVSRRWEQCARVEGPLASSRKP